MAKSGDFELERGPGPHNPGDEYSEEGEASSHGPMLLIDRKPSTESGVAGFRDPHVHTFGSSSASSTGIRGDTPISYGEALKILRHIGGEVVPEGWQGGLPVTYHIGPGPARVEMDVEYDYAQRPVWNVFGKIEGAVEPEKFVLAAGHRDAWVLGARDPTSGAVSLLETARGIAAAIEQGFRPRRSIVFGSWGGEEYFLLGSTEWGEQFGAELREHMVAYINRESYTAGDWGASGNHSLERFVIETSRDTAHPEAPTLYDAWSRRRKNPPRSPC